MINRFQKFGNLYENIEEINNLSLFENILNLDLSIEYR